MWPREASEPSISPEKTILQRAIWFTHGATDKHLVLLLVWMGAKSEAEKNNNNAPGAARHVRVLTVAGTEPSPLHASISSSTPGS